MKSTKLLFLISFLLFFSSPKLFSQTTTYLIDYNNFTTTNCNAFANQPQYGISIGGFTHMPSSGQPKSILISSKRVIEIDCDYFVQGTTYTPQGTRYLILFPFKVGYSYAITINAAAIATDGASYPTMNLSVDNSTYSFSDVCTGTEQFNNTGSSRVINGTTYKNYSLASFVSAINNGQLVISSKPSNNSSSQIYIRTVTIVETAPACIALPTGLTSAPVTNNYAYVSWTPVTNAESYTVDYKLSSSSTWINAPNQTANPTNTSYLIDNLTNATTYNWRVRSNCLGINGSYAQSQFTTSPCNAPAGLNTIPSNTSAVLNWSSVSGAISYDVDFNYTPYSGSSWVNIVSGITTTSTTVNGLSSNTPYRWRVRAKCNSTQFSSYTNIQFLTTGPCPNISNLSTTSITCNSAKLNWTHPPSPAFGYGVVDYKPASSSTWIAAPGFPLYTPYTLTGLSANTTYDWRVRSQCFGQSGGYLQSQFTTFSGSCRIPLLPAESGENSGNKITLSDKYRRNPSKETFDLLSQTGIKAFPSPAKNILMVSVSKPDFEKATVQLINTSGNIVFSISNENFEIISIDVSKYANGIYVLKVNNDRISKTQKIIIQH